MDEITPGLLFSLLYYTVLPIAGGYLLGSIPSGLVLTRLAGQGDIRAIGSGNIGATNVLRTGRKGLAALTLLFDIGKGVAAVLLAAAAAYWLTRQPPPGALPLFPSMAALGAVLGHIFPVWLRFKGGKGVATALGVFVALAWPVGVACIVTWLAVASMSRISSLAALVAMAMAPVYAFIWASETIAVFAVIIAALVIAKHHANIRRLLKGEEPRIGASS